jgi:hypothetical protein
MLFCFNFIETGLGQQKGAGPVKPGVLVPPNEVEPHVEPPSETCFDEEEGKEGMWKFRPVEATQSNGILKYFWLGGIGGKIENNLVGINTSRPSSVLEVNFPRNRRAGAAPGLSVTTGESCSKVGLVAGSIREFPSWVGSYAADGEDIPSGMPFQVRAGLAKPGGFWNPSEGTFIHLNPEKRAIGVNTNAPNATLDVRGDVHADLDIRTDRHLFVAQNASIGFENDETPPQNPNGLTVAGKVDANDLHVAGNARVGSSQVSNLSAGLVSASSDGFLQNSTAGQVRSLLDIEGTDNILPVFKTGGGLGNSPIRMGTTEDGFLAIGYGLSSYTSPLRAHHQFGDLLTLHVDGGSSQLGYNTYTKVISNTVFNYPRILTNKGASKMIQGNDGSITFRNLASAENSEWRSCLSISAQANVGIGLENPEERLHVSGNVFSENLKLSGNTARPLGVGWVFRDNEGWISTKTKEQIISDLGLGAAATAGTAKKMVRYNSSGALSPAKMQEEENGDVRIGELIAGVANSANAGASLYFNGGQSINPQISGNLENMDALYMQRYNEGQDKTTLRINVGDDGGQDKVEIGFYHHNQSGWKQAVALYASGEVHAKKVKVTLDAFPDYVFKPNYKLRSLKETEEFIAQNGHLPEVPCAEEVAENGADLGELNKILLKKVEELTLHLIRMEKEIEALKATK